MVASLCDPYQLAHWRRQIRLHAGDLGSEWAAVEAQADRFVRTFEWYRPFGPVFDRVYRPHDHWRRRARLDWTRLAKRLKRINTKRYRRSVRLLVHDVARTCRLRVKRVKRSALVGRLLSN